MINSWYPILSLGVYVQNIKLPTDNRDFVILCQLFYKTECLEENGFKKTCFNLILGKL